ncbi:uncharacterized protein LOC141673607 [Apium graveolens]|uniref:uncharacterized protein LOC141673607 n=1 Tax=Apium graveolens TaxID=4045 RepID=UPI003D79DC33
MIIQEDPFIKKISEDLTAGQAIPKGYVLDHGVLKFKGRVVLPPRNEEDGCPISMDFIEGLPKSQGWDSTLVVVDRLTKYPHFLPLKHPFTAQGVASVFMRDVVRLHGSTVLSSIEDQLQERDAILDDLKFQLLRAQQRMKFQEDKSRREVEFQVGDSVYLKLQPYHQQSLAIRACAKLAARYYGPFEVVQRIGKVAYKLLLPSTSRIHPVFHVSQLKKAVGEPTPSPLLPPNISDTLV